MNGNRCDRQSLVGVVALFLGITLLTSGCGQKATPSADSGRPVKTMVVSAGGEPHVRSFPGKVEASKNVVLSFQVNGEIVELPARKGLQVKKGEILAQLRQADFQAALKKEQGQLDQARARLQAARSGDRPEQQRRLEAQVRAAEAKLANARATFNRSEQLLRNRAGTREEFDVSQTALRIAEEDLRAAQESQEKGTIGRQEDIDALEAEVRGLEGRVVTANLQLGDSTLRAPYDGVIAERFVEQNQTIRAKEPIVRFQDVNEIDVAVDVPESIMAADLRSADIVQLVAEFSGAPGLQFPVRLKEIAQAADPVTQTFKVRVGMKSPPDVNLLPGMTATVSLTYHRASVLGSQILVPVSAVFKDANGEQVAWVIGQDQHVARRPVKIGSATGSRIEILEGLQPGDRIAVAGVPFLREGMKVRDLGDALGGGE